MKKELQDKYMVILKAINNEEYDNIPIAKELGISHDKVRAFKQDLYRKEYIDRGFYEQRWILTDLGEDTLTKGFPFEVPSEDRKLRLLKILNKTERAVCKTSLDEGCSVTKYYYHKKWLIKNGFISSRTSRGIVTNLGLKAIKLNSISELMGA